MSSRAAVADAPFDQVGAAPAPLRRLAPGVVLDHKYRLDSVIAEGGMGVVWLAAQLDLDRPVAIKVVRDEYARDEDIVCRTLDEARAIAQLKGEHAVRVQEIARLESGAPFIVMEYLEGNDLASELARRGPLPLDEVVDLMLQACEGLAEAHALGVVHRDLKPENLFLALQPDGSTVLKLLDFGVAKRMRPQRARRVTLGGTTVGSPQYMAPEQMHSLPDVDERADVWSLGTILYELLTGVRAFDGATLPEVQRFVLKLEPAPPSSFDPELPDALDLIVQRCLEKDRDLRYPTVAALAADLALLGDERASLRAERTSRVAAGVRRSRIQIIAERPARSAAAAPTPRARRRRTSGALWSFVLAAAVGALSVPVYRAARHALSAGPRLDRAAFRAVSSTRRATHGLSTARLIVGTTVGEAHTPLVAPLPAGAPGSKREAD